MFLMMLHQHVLFFRSSAELEMQQKHLTAPSMSAATSAGPTSHLLIMSSPHGIHTMTNVGIQTDDLSMISSATQTMKHSSCINAVENSGEAGGDVEMCADFHGFLYWDED
jgi:hypothetical protein